MCKGIDLSTKFLTFSGTLVMAMAAIKAPGRHISDPLLAALSSSRKGKDQGQMHEWGIQSVPRWLLRGTAQEFTQYLRPKLLLFIGLGF